MTTRRTTPAITGTYVQFIVGGVHCEGVADRVLPLGAVVPPGWHPAGTYVEPADDDGALQSAEVYISPEDYQRIVSSRPKGPHADLHEHIAAVKAQVTREVIESRHRWLRDVCVPGWYVQNVVAPTPEQLAALVANADGDFTAEDLVNAGCLPGLGSPADQFQEWAFCPADPFDEAWAEELEREKARATAPYLDALLSASREATP